MSKKNMSNTFKFNLNLLLELYNPEELCFDVKVPITKIEVQRAVAELKLSKPKNLEKMSRKEHIEYIAYLTVYKDHSPVIFDFTNPKDFVVSGKHRFFAAYVGRNRTINAFVLGRSKNMNKYLVTDEVKV